MEMITLRRFNAYHIIALTMLIIIVGFFTVSYAYETQSNNKGQVTINVRPLQLEPGQPAKFEVRMSRMARAVSISRPNGMDLPLVVITVRESSNFLN
jgi:quinol-cytochrome oxidoreductase complex cytochrome b subunit